MLAAIAERLDALGPRFRLPLLAVQAVEARSGRKGVLAFACDQDDLAVKLVAALIADVPATVHLLTEYTTVTNEWPPSPAQRAPAQKGKSSPCPQSVRNPSRRWSALGGLGRRPF